MLHLNKIQNSEPNDQFFKRASGRYYTGELVGRQLAKAVASSMHITNGQSHIISIADPFGGDGRLVAWLLEAWREMNLPNRVWDLHLWDISNSGFPIAQERFDRLRSEGFAIQCEFLTTDAFRRSAECAGKFDVVITNPPWEQLKPDRRETQSFEPNVRDDYIASMRSYDEWLAIEFPRAQPRRKFAGWGTNLSRVGFDLSLRIARSGGIVGAVLPASILADDQSVELRKHLIVDHGIHHVAYFPAEEKHYDNADVASITVVSEIDGKMPPAILFTSNKVGASRPRPSEIQLDIDRLTATDFVLPISFGAGANELLQKLAAEYPTWKELEKDTSASFWAGRELDETGIKSSLIPITEASNNPFLKGRMIARYTICTHPEFDVNKPNWSKPRSAHHNRIAWRDVSRPNQKRRMIATLVPAGWVLGNSLGVACFLDGNTPALKALLGLMNSTAFEFQLRSNLATGHVSLSSLRKVSVPTVKDLARHHDLQELVTRALAGNTEADLLIDAYVAIHIYRLNLEEYALLLDQFPKIEPQEKTERFTAFKKMIELSVSSAPPIAEIAQAHVPDRCSTRPASHPLIFNHYSARLSDLDLQMVRSVPEGGNWKDIPITIPSRRLEQIRESFARGEGSRSTYYGRLRRDMPSYTINTYFNRPGNGCHVHPDEDRVISQREAARFQSFPDDFEFLGTQGAISTQIGNAVPPLLAYRIARTLGAPGGYVDLFSGAGGMGLGFKWAGWQPVIANDIEPAYMNTYARNVHSCTITGSITDPAVFDALVAAAKAAKKSHNRLWVIGGPPCQGFSTAGNKRSMDDSRNHLFGDYVRFLERIQPDGFVFENVTGLLNMQGGEVFASIKSAFASVMPHVFGTVISADEHGIPQRRKRVILVGVKKLAKTPWTPPCPITSTNASQSSLFSGTVPSISVAEAIGDLPSLSPGENGSCKPYKSAPQSIYQALMRGQISPESYFDLLTTNCRGWGKQ